MYPKDDFELEMMQEEFKKSEKASVKIIISKESNQCNKICEKSISNVTKNKKKRDIISIDNKSDYILDSSHDKLLKINEALSIFNSEMMSNNNLIENKIDIKTGIPSTFKVENIEDKIKNIVVKENKKKNDEMKKSSAFKQSFESEEYKNMHIKNVDFVKSLSQEEIIKYTQELKASIPQELLDKMKTGYFQNNLDKKSLSSIIYNQPNEQQSEPLSDDESVENSNLALKQIVEETKSQEQFIYVFNYYNKFQ